MVQTRPLRQGEIPPRRRCVVELLYEFDLQVTTVRERDVEVGCRRLPLVGEVVQRSMIEPVERSDADNGGPVSDGGLKVADDVPVLADTAKEFIHGSGLPIEKLLAEMQRWRRVNVVASRHRSSTLCLLGNRFRGSRRRTRPTRQYFRGGPPE